MKRKLCEWKEIKRGSIVLNRKISETTGRRIPKPVPPTTAYTLFVITYTKDVERMMIHECRSDNVSLRELSFVYEYRNHKEF
jgi:hypothetical protein